MSGSYTARVRYAAPPAAVYDALAAPGGPGGWWSTDGGSVTGVGERLRLNWSAHEYVEFEVEEARRPERMRWACVAQHDRNLPLPDEWVGTALDFRLTAAPDGAVLDFEHDGLVAGLECFELCRGGWDFFLNMSVRRLLAVGEGLPYAA